MSLLPLPCPQISWCRVRSSTYLMVGGLLTSYLHCFCLFVCLFMSSRKKISQWESRLNHSIQKWVPLHYHPIVLGHLRQMFKQPWQGFNNFEFKLNPMRLRFRDPIKTIGTTIPSTKSQVPSPNSNNYA